MGRRGEGETRRRGDGEKGRWEMGRRGEGETRRRGDGERGDGRWGEEAKGRSENGARDTRPRFSPSPSPLLRLPRLVFSRVRHDLLGVVSCHVFVLDSFMTENDPRRSPAGVSTDE